VRGRKKIKMGKMIIIFEVLDVLNGKFYNEKFHTVTKWSQKLLWPY